MAKSAFYGSQCLCVRKSAGPKKSSGQNSGPEPLLGFEHLNSQLQRRESEPGVVQNRGRVGMEFESVVWSRWVFRWIRVERFYRVIHLPEIQGQKNFQEPAQGVHVNPPSCVRAGGLTKRQIHKPLIHGGRIESKNYLIGNFRQHELEQLFLNKLSKALWVVRAVQSNTEFLQLAGGDQGKPALGDVAPETSLGRPVNVNGFHKVLKNGVLAVIQTTGVCDCV
mmetsp:Transcript_4401/g.6975  ORF Transcript_4401/g.6975 Transcript_4401/m.6975 type:complete len:223 (+) Transcript_4401:534-1202(+)